MKQYIKVWIAVIILLLVGYGCRAAFGMLDSKEPKPPEVTATVVPGEPQLVEPMVCIRVPATANLGAMQDDGYTVNYDGATNRWIVEDVIVGAAEAEDEPFDACGPVSVIALMERYIIDAN